MGTATFTAVAKLNTGGDRKGFLCNVSFSGNYATGGDTVSIAGGMPLNTIEEVCGLFLVGNTVGDCVGVIDPTSKKLKAIDTTDQSTEAGTGAALIAHANQACVVFGR